MEVGVFFVGKEFGFEHHLLARRVIGRGGLGDVEIRCLAQGETEGADFAGGGLDGERGFERLGRGVGGEAEVEGCGEQARIGGGGIAGRECGGVGADVQVGAVEGIAKIEAERPTVGALHGEGVGRLVGIPVEGLSLRRKEVEEVHFAVVVGVAGGESHEGGEADEEGEKLFVHGGGLVRRWG